MMEQFDDETMARLLKDQPEPKRWKDMTPEEQAAITARKRERISWRIVWRWTSKPRLFATAILVVFCHQEQDRSSAN